MNDARSNGRQQLPFDGALDRPHDRVDPCFMTGKGCVYTEVIDRSLMDRRRSKTYRGFSVMPFRENLNIFHKNCLSLFFRANYPNIVSLDRADEVRRPGIIICEGVCKRIQESDFITVDVSLPNPNVFYEMGLAYGIGHKIILLHHDASQFGLQTVERLKDLGFLAYSYHDLDPILQEDFDRSRNVSQRAPELPTPSPDKPHVLLYEQSLEGSGDDDTHKEDDTHKMVELPDDIPLAFQTHVRSAVGLAISRICSELTSDESSQPVVIDYLDTIRGFRDSVVVRTDARLKEIQSQVDSAYCMVMRTGFKTCHPMTYFWLGYGHARGKNVVPVTVMHERNDPVEDLAFDIRAQRHMFFIEKAPELFERELTSSLRQMVSADFSEWSRKRFWDYVIGRRGEVSIFTGALHNETFGREMIGDWDLRTASELTSYFASRQYRAKIENPVYTPEYPKRDQAGPLGQYIDRLRDMLADKNCILIASPDVNPLTEIVFGHVFNMSDADLFTELREPELHPDAIVVVKERSSTLGHNEGPRAQRCFYKEVLPQDGVPPRRGFESPHFRNRRILESFVSQVDEEREEARVFGHLVILRNPFVSSDEHAQQRFIIVLNGVSGPATFALTHVLTGGMTKDFVAYSESFRPEAQAEKILRTLMQYMSRPSCEVVDCIITVRVGASSDEHEARPTYTSDWRRILGWSLNEDVRHPPIKTSP